MFFHAVSAGVFANHIYTRAMRTQVSEAFYWLNYTYFLRNATETNWMAYTKENVIGELVLYETVTHFVVTKIPTVPDLRYQTLKTQTILG